MSYESQTSGIIDHAFLENLYEGLNGNGITSGGVVTATGSDRVLTYTAVEGIASGVRFQANSSTVTLDAGDASNPRMDMIVWDKTAGAVAVVKGTATAESSSQTRPPLGTLDDNDLILAVAYVPTNASVILDANIFDRRVEPALQKGADITAASTLTLVDGLSFDITGATGITAIATAPEGRVVRFQFDSTPTLTHHGTNLILQSASNFKASAGDVLWFESLGAGKWREVNRHLATSASTLPVILNNIRDNYALLCLVDGLSDSGAAAGEAAGIGLSVQVDGSGAVDSSGLRGGAWIQATNTTANSQSLLRTPGTVATGDRNPHLSAILTTDAGGSEMKAQGWGFLDDSVVSSFTTTTRHGAMFRQVTTGALFAKTGNGSNEETTSLSGSHTLGSAGVFEVLTVDNGVTWLFRIAGTQVASHTSQIPTVTTQMYVVLGIENNTTTDVRMTDIDLIVAYQDRT